MARYWESRPQQFVSQFVPHNLELQQGIFDDLQKKQDAYKIKVDSLKTDIEALPQDTPEAFNDAKSLNEKANALRSYDVNDPNQSKQLMKGMNDLNFELGNFSKRAAYKTRVDEHGTFKKAILDNKDYEGQHAFLKQYQLNKLDVNNTAEVNPINYKSQDATFNHIKAPEQIGAVDLGKIVSNSFSANNMTKDGTFFDMNNKSTGVNFHTLIQDGHTEGFGVQKVLGSLAGTVVTPEVIAYYQAKSDNKYGADKRTDGAHATNEANAVVYDERETILDINKKTIPNPNKGNILGFNPETLLGKELNGYVVGKVGQDKTRTNKIVTDTDAINKSKEERQKIYEAPLTQTGAGDEVSGIPSFADTEFKKQFVTATGELDYEKLDKTIATGVEPGFWNGVAEGARNLLVGIETIIPLTLGGTKQLFKEAKGKTAIDAASFKASLKTLAEDRAKLIGYEGEVTPASYNEIFKQSEEFAKDRGMSLQFSNEGERNGYTKRLNETKETFDFTNMDGSVISKEILDDPKNKFRPLERLSRPRTNSDGTVTGSESVTKVVDSAGNIYYARDKAKEESKFFDKTFQVNNSGLNYLRTGVQQNDFSANKDEKPLIVKNINTSVTNALNKLNMPLGFKIAAINDSPESGEYNVTINPDPKDKRTQIIMRVVKDEDGDYGVAPLTNGEQKNVYYLSPNEYMSTRHQKFVLSGYGTSYREKVKSGISEDKLAEAEAQDNSDGQ